MWKCVKRKRGKWRVGTKGETEGGGGEGGGAEEKLVGEDIDHESHLMEGEKSTAGRKILEEQRRKKRGKKERWRRGRDW